MRDIRILVIVVMAAVIAACSTGEQQGPVAAASTKPMPVLMFQPDTLDLGLVDEGKTAKGDLILRNTGDLPLTITDIQSSCGCTTAMPAQRLLPPGGFTEVHVKVDTFAKRGKVDKTLWASDDQGHTAVAHVRLSVRHNPHMALSGRSLFDAPCASCHAAPARGKRTGPEIYAAVCVMCHGAGARGGYAPALRGRHDAAALKGLISNGAGNQYMPGFARARGGPLNPAQVQALSQWLATLP